MTPAVSVSSLTKKYGEVEAVRGIDLEVAAGETFGLLSPNDAGKSTMIKDPAHPGGSHLGVRQGSGIRPHQRTGHRAPQHHPGQLPDRRAEAALPRRPCIAPPMRLAVFSRLPVSSVTEPALSPGAARFSWVVPRRVPVPWRVPVAAVALMGTAMLAIAIAEFHKAE